ncbi:MAG: endonuclease V [Armatimonadetes bacterium]|nr:endonuclease V [Armatimonadota bacterium]
MAGAVHATHGPCAWGCVAVWDCEQRRVVAWAVARENIPLPYKPGRLAFSVSPPITAALLRLPQDAHPEALIVHGHGLAHPRRYGLACHLGMLHRLPTVGVAQELLVGTHDKVPARRGEWRPVMHDGEIVGAALRTRAEAKVIYVSPGWGVDLEEAVAVVMQATTRYRWPEPVRHARMRLRVAHRKRLQVIWGAPVSHP